jgi:plexin A
VPRRSGPAFCPRVNATAGGSPEILVSSGLQKSVRVKVDNIAQFIVQTRFVCQFNIEGRVTSVNAQLLSDTIYCDEMDFTYTSRAPNITATFAGKVSTPVYLKRLFCEMDLVERPF